MKPESRRPGPGRRSVRTLLVTAVALALSACTVTVPDWRPPPGHPASPDARPGRDASTMQAPAPVTSDPVAPRADEPPTNHDGHRGRHR